ncbi:hypothetical protein EVAR_3354_1 [Eumeta japonica]|uniref:Uncharacterized protein n=1 Tax=Eumeta variegata TaxID=151549 RepID=A0A4C1SS57_EUMVA|nr:hypothetical protein EVAR_3354_1 [Eumeta japonica]
MRSLRSMYEVTRKDRCRDSDGRERCGLKEDVVTRVDRGRDRDSEFPNASPEALFRLRYPIPRLPPAPPRCPRTYFVMSAKGTEGRPSRRQKRFLNGRRILITVGCKWLKTIYEQIYSKANIEDLL